MTAPGAGEGKIHVDVEVSGDDVEQQLRDELNDAGNDLEPDAHRLGQDLGDEVGKGVGDGVRRQRKKVAKELEDLIPADGVRFRFRTFFDRNSGNFVRRRVVDDLEEIAHDAFESVTKPGGPFSRIGSGIADAIGAGFNVSGRSQLIAILIPAIGAIIAVVAAAIAALQPVGAFFLTLPSLISSIAVQFIVLSTAIGGIIGPIQAAFNAQNAKEFQQALMGLPAPAREFVKAIMPLKNLLSDLKTIIMADFFRALGTNIADLIKVVDPILRIGIRDVALGLGAFFHNLVELFKSPIFSEFLINVFAITKGWISTFGPAFIKFLSGLIQVGNALMPFITAFGEEIAGIFQRFGAFLVKLVISGRIDKFMDTAIKLLDLLFELFDAFAAFVAVFVNVFAETDAGERLFGVLIDALEILAFYFASPAGQQAIMGFTSLLVLLTQIFVGLIIVIFEVVGIIGALIDAVEFGLTAIVAFLDFVGSIFSTLWDLLVAKFKQWGKDLHDFFTITLPNFIKGIPEMIRLWLIGIFGDAGDWLYKAGANLIKGLIRGMLGQKGSVANASQQIVGSIAAYIPHSPAKEGPFSGQNSPQALGGRFVQQYAMGMEGETQSLANTSNNVMGNINFGTGAIRVEYNGVNPTPDQARITGSAIGDGLAAKILMRRTVAAVTTL